MKTSKSAVFLFELMIIILVFTLAAAVCTQIFARAYKMSEESHELTMASVYAQTEAELWKGEAQRFDSPMGGGWKLYYSKYYDKDWAAVASEENAYYTVAIEERDEYRVAGGEMNEADVNVYRTSGGEAFYSLHVSKFKLLVIK